MGERYGVFNFHAPMTTPWSPPPDCSEIWDMSSIVFDSDTIIPALWNDPKDERFTSCMPSVWTENDVFHFAPAVCPSGWTTVTMATLGDQRIDGSDVGTMGICCSPGFDLAYVEVGLVEFPCTSTVKGVISGRADHGSGPMVTATGGVMAHPAWLIGWMGDDASTLTPRPPVVTNRLVDPTAVSSTSTPPKQTDASSLASLGRPGLGSTKRVILVLTALMLIAYPS